MRRAFQSIHRGSALGTLPRLLTGLLLFAAFLFSAASPASACGLDWANVGVVWTNGSLTGGPYTLTGAGCPSGATVSIVVSTSAAGAFTLSTPAEDCASGCVNSPQLFGSLHNLGVVFDPSTGTPVVTSPIIITATFSVPLTTVQFEISDIDFSVGGAGQDHRLDQVTVTSNVGPPTLSFKTGGSHTFSISTNTATANCTVSPQPTCNAATDTTAAPSDSGTVVVNFGALAVTTVTITYTEAGNGANPAGRGIGVLAGLTATPVELMGFAVE